jgi:hypothetical protein
LAMHLPRFSLMLSAPEAPRRASAAPLPHTEGGIRRGWRPLRALERSAGSGPRGIAGRVRPAGRRGPEAGAARTLLRRRADLSVQRTGWQAHVAIRRVARAGSGPTSGSDCPPSRRRRSAARPSRGRRACRLSREDARARRPESATPRARFRLVLRRSCAAGPLSHLAPKDRYQKDVTRDTQSCGAGSHRRASRWRPKSGPSPQGNKGRRRKALPVGLPCQ